MESVVFYMEEKNDIDRMAIQKCTHDPTSINRQNNLEK